MNLFPTSQSNSCHCYQSKNPPKTKRKKRNQKKRQYPQEIPSNEYEGGMTVQHTHVEFCGAIFKEER